MKYCIEIIIILNILSRSHCRRSASGNHQKDSSAFEQRVIVTIARKYIILCIYMIYESDTRVIITFLRGFKKNKIIII